MFNIGLGELLFIAILALVALGPERLPKLMRQLGEIAYQIRVVVEQFNNQFADELKPIREIQSLTTELNPMRQIGSVVSQAGQPQPTIAPPPASPTAAQAAAQPAAAQPAAAPFAVQGASHPMSQISKQMAASNNAPAAVSPPAPSSDEETTAAEPS